MKEIALKKRNKSAHEDYDPVELSENVMVEVDSNAVGDNLSVEGAVTRNEKNIGRYVLNESQTRLFVNVNIDGLKRNTAREIIETIASLILQLIPEEQEENENEEAAE